MEKQKSFKPNASPKGRLWGRQIFFAICIFAGIILIFAGVLNLKDNSIVGVTCISNGGIVIIFSLIGDTIIIFRNNFLDILNNKKEDDLK